MSEERQYGRFWDIVGADDFSVMSMAKNPENLEELQELLYYFDPDRAETISKELASFPEKDASKIVRNIASSYPLSQALLWRILRDVRFSDSAAVYGYDFSENVRRAIKELLNTTKEQTFGGKTTNYFREYEKDIDSLEKEAAELKKQDADFRELREKRSCLQKEVETMKHEFDRNEQTHIIENLERELQSIERDKHDLEEQQHKLHDSLDQAKKELKKMEKRLDPKEEVGILRELLRKFPPDVEEVS